MEEITMKLSGWVSAGILSLLLGASTAVFAQDKPDDVKPQQEEQKKDEAKPRKDEAKPPKQDQAKPPKREEQESRDQAKPDQEHPERQMDHARPAAKSERIPDDKFRAHFGREHTVVINQPVIVEGQPRFQSGGYWFIISDPWPVGWAYTDQCYIDYVDGEYFLFDLLHPGVRVVLVVTL
jgi:hypothetical protein